jgi:hypothetical protein
MGYLFVAVTKIQAGTGNGVSASVSSTAGNALFAAGSAYEAANTSNTLTISGGGTWTVDHSTNYGVGAGAQAANLLASCPSATGGAQTVTISGGNGSGAAAGIYEFSGNPPSSILDSTPPAVATGNSASATTNTETNVQTQALFLGVVGLNVPSGLSSITGTSTGWTYPAGAQETDGNNFWCWGSGYKIANAVGTESSNWTVTTNPWGASIACYKAPVVAASNLPVFSDATGHGNQSHLVYAANQQRWWLFVLKSKTATVVSAYVSSSNDITPGSGTTWSAATDSPVFPNSRALDSTGQRQLGVLSLTNGTTDIAHLSVGIVSGTSWYTEHIRCTFTGAGSITWESWTELTVAGFAVSAIRGNALGVGSTGFMHEAGLLLNGNADAAMRISVNADTGASWTNSWNTSGDTDTSMTNECNAYAYAALASGAMLVVYDNGGAAEPSLTNLRYNKYTFGTAWPTTGSGDVFPTTSTQNQNDWCLCRVDATHVYVIRRESANTFLCRMYDGSSWSTPVSTIPVGVHLAGSGLFAASDGTNLWLFVMDSATGQVIRYVKGSNANGTISFDASWTVFKQAGNAARNFISGCPTVGNNQVGVIYTVANGTNFDIVAASLDVTPQVVATPPVKANYSNFPKNPIRRISQAA